MRIGPSLVIVLPVLLSLAPLFGQQAAPDTVITMERTACYGPCPVYKLTLTADGTVTFEGRKYVKTIGTAKHRVAEGKLMDLAQEFDKIGYFDLDDEYTIGSKHCREYGTDNPTAITSISVNGRAKRVEHYYGCRGANILEALTRLESKIDEAANADQWIK